MATTVRMRKKLGKESMISTNRIRRESTHPPLYPAIAPTRIPMRMEIPTATNPTDKEIWDPYSIRLNTSLPN
jgi:hypothetical protein